MLRFLCSVSYAGRLAPQARLTQTSFRLFCNHSARTTAENKASLLLCDVTAYARRCLARVAWQRSVREPQKTVLLYCQKCVFIGPLPSNGSTCHNIHMFQEAFLALCNFYIYLSSLTYLLRSSYTSRCRVSFFFHFDHFTEGRTTWTSDQLVARPLSEQGITQAQNKHIHIPNIHVLRGIRTHDLGFQASEDNTCIDRSATESDGKVKVR
jgi:hypothetical protein